MPFAGAAAGQARFNWPRARRTSWPKWPNFTVHGPRRRYLDNGRENGRGGCKRVITPRSGTIQGCMQRGMGSHLGERRLSFTPRLATAPCHSDLLCFEGGDPDDQDTYGNTALHMVVVTGQLVSINHLKPESSSMKNLIVLCSLTHSVRHPGL